MNMVQYAVLVWYSISNLDLQDLIHSDDTLLVLDNEHVLMC
jgi:hypothetical protein